MKPSLKNSRLYPRIYNSRFYTLSLMREELRAIQRDYLKNKENLTIVDFGCGNMPYKPLFQAQTGRYIGVDSSRNPVADVFLSPDGRVPLSDESADVVLSTQVLEHTTSPEEYLRECRRLLKPAGHLILSTHGYWMYHPDPEDYWRWTASGLRKILEDNNFKILRFTGLLGLPGTGLHLFQDGIFSATPNILKPVLSIMFQLCIAGLDKITSPKKKNRDACVYMAVATKRQQS